MTSPYRVLVAEDEPTYGFTVVRFLKTRGYEAKLCATGKATLKAMAEAEWDVLLLDLQLPDANGLDLLGARGESHQIGPLLDGT
jgi:DNA-binding response OmpR family regulator